MAGVNKVILVGNLGQDPEIKNFDNDGKLAKFSLATSSKFTDKGGNKQEKTEWHKIVVWGKLAGICERYLSKGNQVYIEGSLETKKWTNKDGKDQYTTQIVAKEMKMLGGKPKQSSGGRDDSREIVGHDQSYGDTGSRGDFEDDDIPF